MGPTGTTGGSKTATTKTWMSLRCGCVGVGARAVATVPALIHTDVGCPSSPLCLHQRTKTLKDLEAQALREAQAILRKEEARKKAEERAKKRAEKQAIRNRKLEKRRKEREAEELRQKFIDQEIVRSCCVPPPHHPLVIGHLRTR